MPASWVPVDRLGPCAKGPAVHRQARVTSAAEVVVSTPASRIAGAAPNVASTQCRVAHAGGGWCCRVDAVRRGLSEERLSMRSTRCRLRLVQNPGRTSCAATTESRPGTPDLNSSDSAACSRRPAAPRRFTGDLPSGAPFGRNHVHDIDRVGVPESPADGDVLRGWQSQLLCL